MGHEEQRPREENVAGETGLQGQAPPPPEPPSQREEAPVSDTTDAERDGAPSASNETREHE